MFLNIIKKDKDTVIAVCDRDLIGKIFQDHDSGAVLNLRAHSSFYVGKLASKPEVLEALKDFTSANLVGKRSITVALEAGLAEQKHVKKVAGTPYLHLYKF